MTDGAEQLEGPRPLGVRLLALGVDHFGRIPHEHGLARDEREPCARPSRDEVQRAFSPVARNLRRRQPPSARVLRQFRGVRAFEFGRAASRTQRLVRAVGAGIVPDVEIGAELRRRDVETSADHAVTCRHRREHDREAGREQPETPDAVAQCVAGLRQRPNRDDDDEHQRVLAREAQSAERESQTKEEDV